jgi:hypothetical protein
MFSVISLPCMANTLSLPLIICHTDSAAIGAAIFTVGWLAGSHAR